MQQRFFCLLLALFLTAIASASAQSPHRGLSISLNLTNPGNWGTYHALIIGINDYKRWPRLKTAVKDATVIRDTLVSRYGFAEKNVILRTNKDASRKNITRDIRYLARSMGKEDNLFIYYAGHGQLDDFTGDGYWVPAEGALKDPDTWVANSYIKAILSSEKLQAKNVVVIADSCYSGSMLRGGPSLMSLEDQRYREKLAEKAALRSRQVISSGGLEPVTDGGTGGHSLFAYYLIDALLKNDREVIDLENLFHTRVWKPVTEIGAQRPNVGRLKTPMDEDGQFVLYNAARVKERAQKQANLEAKKQKQARQSAKVAPAEMALQRQRIELEKQKLAYEREQLDQRKAIEQERLKLEKQKQEFEYAKLQALLKEMEEKSKKNEARVIEKAAAIAPLKASVDKKDLSNREITRNRYKLALLPIKVPPKIHSYHQYLDWEAESIRGIVSVIDDEKLEWTYTYKEIQDSSHSVELLTAIVSKEDIQVWKKESFLAKNEPDWEKVKKLGPKINAHIAVLINVNPTTSRASRVDIYVYDYRRASIYSEIGKKSVHYNALSMHIERVAKKLINNFYNSEK